MNIYKTRLLKNKTEEELFTASQKLAREITKIFELYQTYQPDYDIFDVVNQPQLILFTEKFEHMVEELEEKMKKISKGQDPYASTAIEGKLSHNSTKEPFLC